MRPKVHTNLKRYSKKKKNLGRSTATKATASRLNRLLEDRSRIGRDLYCMLQSLHAMGANVETSQRIRSNQPVEAKESDDKTIRQINQLIHEVRGLIRELESGTV